MLDAGRARSEHDTIEEMTITTTTPRILDGIAIAGQIKAEVAVEVQQLAARGITPGLAVILVGDVPASQIYVRSKVKTCGELGIFSEMLTPPDGVTTDEMLALVAELNAREDIDGILIQLPFVATALYTGPIARALGGMDLSWIVGLLVTSPVYYWLAKRTRAGSDSEMLLAAQLDAPGLRR